MKGVIFTEFLNLVEQEFGLEMVDKLIHSVDLESGGVYTSLGTYHHQELLSLVAELSKHSDLPQEALITLFGEHLIRFFTKRYPHFFESEQNTLEFLTKLEGHIHSEVRKLYQNTELPRFEWEYTASNVLSLTYLSRRPFAPLARGMIEATARYYGDDITIQETDLSHNGLNKVRFVITRTESEGS